MNFLLANTTFANQGNKIYVHMKNYHMHAFLCYFLMKVWSNYHKR